MIKLKEQMWNKKMSQSEFEECVNNGMTIEEIKCKFNYSRRQPILVMAHRLGLYDILQSREEEIDRKKYDYDKIEELIKKKLTYEQIRKRIGCSRDTIKRVKKLRKIKQTSRRMLLDIDFTDDEFQVLYGTLLGDAYLLKHDNKSTVGGFTHCINQKDFIEHKQKLLNRFVKSPRYQSKYDKRVNKSYSSYFCYIMASLALEELYPKVYNNKIKYIDKDLLYKLDGRGIAIWYMDDGSYSEYGYILCTNAFSDQDLNIIQEFFKEKFDINTSIRKDHTIYIKADSKQKFKDLISPYMIDSMMYKL